MDMTPCAEVRQVWNLDGLYCSPQEMTPFNLAFPGDHGAATVLQLPHSYQPPVFFPTCSDDTHIHAPPAAFLASLQVTTQKGEDPGCQSLPVKANHVISLSTRDCGTRSHSSCPNKLL